MDYQKWFVERLSSLRLEKGISARDMSLSLGQSESYINKIENHRTMPSMIGFFSICEFFEISPSEFFDVGISSPTAYKELIASLSKLSPQKISHLTQIANDMK